MTRDEAKRVLEIHLEHWQRLTKEKICTEQEGAETISAFNIAIKALEQEPKTGHWKVVPCNNKHGEYRPNKYACSECGWEIDLCRGLQQNTGHRLFCEHCGAKMESES